MQSVQDVQERHERRRTAVELLTADRVGQLLGVDRSTVYRMAAAGRLPAVKVGRQWRFPADDVAALVNFDGGGDPVAGTPAFDAALVEPLLEVVAESLGVMIVVTDMHGHPLTRVMHPCPQFAAQAGSPAAIAACVAEWRALAAGLDFQPRLREGRLGFECARAFIRSGTALVGMVLAGGVAAEGVQAGGLYDLDERQRRHVLAALPRIAAALSRLAGHRDDHDGQSAGQEGRR